MQQMSIYGISFDVVGKQPVVLLKTEDGERYLPIWIGHAEAGAILARLQDTDSPRPMTHDLLANLVGDLGAHVVRVTVTDLREGTFYAAITLRRDGTGEIEVDSRPSDAIALAVRVDAPIFVADEVIAENAVQFTDPSEREDETVEKFKEFLDQVSPDDFADS
ncbi:MAG: bifunctional nuclease family protein [Thermoleophilia bacterium]|nr:bifunctional nuclease family protein [Thermoleophilia bacterium]